MNGNLDRADELNSFFNLFNHIRRCLVSFTSPSHLSVSAVRWRGSWRNWTGTRPESLCGPAMWDSAALLQPHPEPGEGSSTLPVPKRCHPSSSNDGRPVALTWISKQAPSRTHCSLLVVVRLELKTPSYTCFNEPTVIWTKQAALWGSCSSISPEHLPPSSLLFHERNSRTITWITDYNRPQFET